MVKRCIATVPLGTRASERHLRDGSALGRQVDGCPQLRGWLWPSAHELANSFSIHPGEMRRCAGSPTK